MNNFFAWINSGTTAQQNKKRFACYMIAVVAFLLVVSLLTLAVMGIVSAVKKSNGDQDGEETVDPNRGFVSTTFAENQLHKGDLLIVDEAHPYIAEANSDVETIILENGRAKIDDSVFYSSETLYDEVKKEALDAMNKMLVDFYNKTQDDNLYVNKYQTINTFELRYTTGIPGTPRPAITESDTYKWIFDNAYKYGFVQLYSAPEASTAEGAETAEDMTHIFRYVGTVHAQLMRDKKCETLADYIELLKTTSYKKPFSVSVDKVSYKVYYTPQTETPMIPEKYKDSYTVSGNNVDGYIVTYSTAKK